MLVFVYAEEELKLDKPGGLKISDPMKRELLEKLIINWNVLAWVLLLENMWQIQP